MLALVWYVSPQIITILQVETCKNLALQGVGAITVSEDDDVDDNIVDDDIYDYDRKDDVNDDIEVLIKTNSNDIILWM